MILLLFNGGTMKFLNDAAITKLYGTDHSVTPQRDPGSCAKSQTIVSYLQTVPR